MGQCCLSAIVLAKHCWFRCLGSGVGSRRGKHHEPCCFIAQAVGVLALVGRCERPPPVESHTPRGVLVASVAQSVHFLQRGHVRRQRGAFFPPPAEHAVVELDRDDAAGGEEVDHRRVLPYPAVFRIFDRELRPSFQKGEGLLGGDSRQDVALGDLDPVVPAKARETQREDRVPKRLWLRCSLFDQALRNWHLSRPAEGPARRGEPHELYGGPRDDVLELCSSFVSGEVELPHGDLGFVSVSAPVDRCRRQPG